MAAVIASPASTATGAMNFFFNQAPLGTATQAAATLSGLELFPNPVTAGVLHLRLPLTAVPAGTAGQVELYTTLGQLAQRVPLPKSSGQELTAQVDLRALPPGLYTCRLTLGSVHASQRVVVE